MITSIGVLGPVPGRWVVDWVILNFRSFLLILTSFWYLFSRVQVGLNCEVLCRLIVISKTHYPTVFRTLLRGVTGQYRAQCPIYRWTVSAVNFGPKGESMVTALEIIGHIIYGPI